MPKVSFRMTSVSVVVSAYRPARRGKIIGQATPGLRASQWDSGAPGWNRLPARRNAPDHRVVHRHDLMQSRGADGNPLAQSRAGGSSPGHDKAGTGSSTVGAADDSFRRPAA